MRAGMTDAPRPILTREALADALGGLRARALDGLPVGEFSRGYVTALGDCLDALEDSPAIVGRLVILGQWIGAADELDRGYQAALASVRELLDHGTAPQLPAAA